MRRGRGRREKHERVEGAEGSTPEAVARPATPEGLSLDLVQILDTLDEDDRALLLLKYAEGYSHEELAAIFEISVSACKMRISRAREKIQKQFQDQGD
jgi:RNA polymerase sigma factor (sigma-70 family)